MDWEQIDLADTNLISNDEDESEKYFSILLQVNLSSISTFVLLFYTNSKLYYFKYILIILG